MLKLNASFSKKVPAEVEFSSKSYHASIEVELSDGLSKEQLQSKIHETFEMVKQSVENEINGVAQPTSKYNNSTIPYQQRGNRNNQQQQGGKENTQATSKQLKYLNDLAKKKNINLFAYIRDFGHTELSQLKFSECSMLINKFKSKAA